MALTDAQATTSAQYAYTPYGRSLGSTNAPSAISNPFLFVGAQGVMEELPGLYFMRARYYSAEAGVFLSTDPIKHIGPTWLPLAYAYANSNPLRYMDPLGESWLSSVVHKVVRSVSAGVKNLYDDVRRLSINRAINTITDWKNDTLHYVGQRLGVEDFVDSLTHWNPNWEVHWKPDWEYIGEMALNYAICSVLSAVPVVGPALAVAYMVANTAMRSSAGTTFEHQIIHSSAAKSLISGSRFNNPFFSPRMQIRPQSQPSGVGFSPNTGFGFGRY
jgi:RHS repeat-associated protein